MRRSIATHTIGTSVPALDSPSLILRGAGHYETGCAPCHGRPGVRMPVVPQAMLPAPPRLRDTATHWEPDELFYIVKHGVKLSGMPAWPAQQRDDEVHAVVAFLLELPRLDGPGYRRLVFGDVPQNAATAPLRQLADPTPVPAAVQSSCGRCHGAEGAGRGLGAFPVLAGQSPAYLRRALQAYARGERHSGIMQPVSVGLGEDEMQALAEYYASLPPPSVSGRPPADAAAIGRGRAIAMEGIASQRVPSCADCHGPATHQRNPAFPRLAGQYSEYLALQLELFANGHRGGSAYAHLMNPVASRLTPRQRQDVALYYSSLAGPVFSNPQP